MTDQSTTDVDAWLEAFETDPAVEAEDATDLRRIGEALVGIDRAESDLVAAVAAARTAGRSWTEVANVLGVSRQAARQRFADAVVTTD